MNKNTATSIPDSSRRALLTRAGQALAAIAVSVVGIDTAIAADAKKKAKASKEDFYFQQEPGENGHRCETCVNFEPTVGDKGTCALSEGEVCKTCYCQGWTDKQTGKKAG